MPCGGPVAMAVKQSADDPTAQHAFERFIFFARLPLGNNLIAIREAAHVQPLGIRRSATKTSEIRRVSFLNTTLHKIHGRYCRGGTPCRPYNYPIDDRNCWRSLKRWILPVAV